MGCLESFRCIPTNSEFQWWLSAAQYACLYVVIRVDGGMVVGGLSEALWPGRLA